MTYVDSIDLAELRVILCLEFDRHAPPADVAALKAAFIDCPNTLHSIESTGSFDFLAEIAAPNMAWWNKWLKTLAVPLAKLVGRCETSFVCRRFIRRSKGEQALWVPTSAGLMRLDCDAIDKVAADGDYVQIFSEGQKWLLHSTMHNVRSRLDPDHFLQLHRSIIVRRDFIKRLGHQGRAWTAYLRDGTSERISKNHVADALDAAHLSTRQRDSSKAVKFADRPLARLTNS